MLKNKQKIIDVGLQMFPFRVILNYNRDDTVVQSLALLSHSKRLLA